MEHFESKESPRVAIILLEIKDSPCFELQRRGIFRSVPNGDSSAKNIGLQQSLPSNNYEEKAASIARDSHESCESRAELSGIRRSIVPKKRRSLGRHYNRGFQSAASARLRPFSAVGTVHISLLWAVPAALRIRSLLLSPN